MPSFRFYFFYQILSYFGVYHCVISVLWLSFYLFLSTLLLFSWFAMISIQFHYAAPKHIYYIEIVLLRVIRANFSEAHLFRVVHKMKLQFKNKLWINEQTKEYPKKIKRCADNIWCMPVYLIYNFVWPKMFIKIFKSGFGSKIWFFLVRFPNALNGTEFSRDKYQTYGRNE